MFIKLCDQLKNARQSIGLTQDQVAEKLHISRQAVSQWETGKSYPDIENLRLLNSIYSTDLSELLNCKPKKTTHVSILNRRFLITVIFVGVLGIFLCYVVDCKINPNAVRTKKISFL
ncbi:helix-turn-helix domain-containing protein [Latilactobacillus sakei]|uniref:helix-turn-helix domain-containing protein n=1 Tax=Latilactobacillus sakei TaxID=1599 RepID=UPI00388AAA24